VGTLNSVRSSTSAESSHRTQAVRAADHFRTDVQALRAVAVIGVVAYHLWPHWLVGGFVGVDVFYVISGYLITQHLMREANANGSIRLTQFWARRIRRLFPAAFAVLAASAVLLLLVMPPLTWRENLEEIAASALYFENWLLGFHSVDYLASEDSASIVQHYWSLSVEEQFYIVWPLLMLGAIRLGERSDRMRRTTAAVIALAAVTSISLLTSIIDTPRSPAFAFFATYIRAWEFGLGGLVALTSLPDSLQRPGLHQATSWSGFALIAASMLMISDRLPFPGAIALLPTLGAALVLRSHPGDARWSPIQVASHPWVQWVGDCSYSIYLWHWPLIIAAPWALNSTISWRVKLIIFAATLILAGLSKRYIEDPIRTRRSWSLRRWPNYAFAAAGMGIAVLLVPTGLALLHKSNQAVASAYRRSASADARCFGAAALENSKRCAKPFRRPSASQLAFAASDIGSAGQCQAGPDVSKLSFCQFGEVREPRRTIVVVGNSHAGRLVPAVAAYGAQRGWKILLAAKTSCLGLSSIPVARQRAENTCVTWTASLQQWILAHRPDAVIFASHGYAQAILAGPGANANTVQLARRNVVEAWSTYARAGIPVIVTSDVPGTRPQSAPECIARSRAAYDPCALPRSSVVRANLVTDLAQTYPRLVRYVSLTPLFCDMELCHSVVGGVVIYSDSHHVTETYSRTMATYLGGALERAMRH
jgi:peptidoglycan/LPS O-acetylase OafA/YrhL